MLSQLVWGELNCRPQFDAKTRGQSSKIHLQGKKRDKKHMLVIKCLFVPKPRWGQRRAFPPLRSARPGSLRPWASAPRAPLPGGRRRPRSPDARAPAACARLRVPKQLMPGRSGFASKPIPKPTMANYCKEGVRICLLARFNSIQHGGEISRNL